MPDSPHILDYASPRPRPGLWGTMRLHLRRHRKLLIGIFVGLAILSVLAWKVTWTEEYDDYACRICDSSYDEYKFSIAGITVSSRKTPITVNELYAKLIDRPHEHEWLSICCGYHARNLFGDVEGLDADGRNFANTYLRRLDKDFRQLSLADRRALYDRLLQCRKWAEIGAVLKEAQNATPTTQP